jgi:hypothetical protein
MIGDARMASIARFYEQSVLRPEPPFKQLQKEFGKQARRTRFLHERYRFELAYLTLLVESVNNYVLDQPNFH